MMILIHHMFGMATQHSHLNQIMFAMKNKIEPIFIVLIIAAIVVGSAIINVFF
jgi:multisubunit Na+/H+ antiporter MnhC subunit